MQFESKLIPGLFIKRYKRFFADIKINKKIITAHCPNTGSMLGLLKKGNKVWVSESQNPNRKYIITIVLSVLLSIRNFVELDPGIYTAGFVDKFKLLISIIP